MDVPNPNAYFKEQKTLKFIRYDDMLLNFTVRSKAGEDKRSQFNLSHLQEKEKNYEKETKTTRKS